MPLHPGFYIPAPTAAAVSGHSRRHNQSGGSILGNGNRLFDPLQEEYLIGRLLDMNVLTLNKLTASGERPGRISELQLMRDHNPNIYCILHMQHQHLIPAFKQKSRIFITHVYEYLNANDRTDAIVYIDVDDAGTVINGNAVPASSGTQSGVCLRINDAGVRDRVSDLAHDLLTGGNLSGIGVGGGDISEFVGWGNDSTQFVEPNFNAQFMRPFTNGTGVIDLVESVVGSQLRQFTINKRPGAGVVTNAVLIWPVDNTAGFIGYRVATYTEINIEDARITLEALPGGADGITQDYVPADGDKFCFNDRGNDTTSADWNADGTPVSFPEGTNEWGPPWIQYLTDTRDKVEATNTRRPLVGANSLKRSAERKELTGWEVPHAFADAYDVPWGENYSTLSGIDASGAEYDVSGSNITKWMRVINFGKTFINPNPHISVRDKSRGAHIESLIRGSTYGSLDYKDANILAFYQALNVLSSDDDRQIITAGMYEGAGNVPLMVETQWLDLEGSPVFMAPIGTYLEDDGNTPGSEGPFHEYTWATADAGNRIFIRRRGNIVIVINADDWPFGATSYGVAHKGDITPRTTADEITPAQWAAVRASGLLASDEAMRHVNFGTYINATMTAAYQAENPGHWGGLSVGPEQTHPNDGDGTFAVQTHPGIARDATLYGGTWSVKGQTQGGNVNELISYFMGPIQVVYLEAYKP